MKSYDSGGTPFQKAGPWPGGRSQPLSYRVSTPLRSVVPVSTTSKRTASWETQNQGAAVGRVCSGSHALAEGAVQCDSLLRAALLYPPHPVPCPPSSTGSPLQRAQKTQSPRRQCGHTQEQRAVLGLGGEEPPRGRNAEVVMLPPLPRPESTAGQVIFCELVKNPFPQPCQLIGREQLDVC